MSVSTTTRTLVIVGLPARLSLERATDLGKAIDDLVASINGRSTVDERLTVNGRSKVKGRSTVEGGLPVGQGAHDASLQNFGGLPIAERQLVDALAKHGTYDRYCVLVNDAARRAAVEDEIHASTRDERFVVRAINDLRSERFGDVMIHAAGSNAVAAIATRERCFDPPTPVHLFLSGLSDPLSVVPKVQTLFTAAGPHDCLTPLSRSNRVAAEKIFDHVSRYYEARWGVTRRFEGRFTDACLGVDVERFARDETSRAIVRARLGLDDGVTVFLFVGRLGAGYKADLGPLVRAFHRELGGDNRARLVLAGHDEGAAPQLSALIHALGAERQIAVIPDVDSARKKLLYDIADVFVSPSDNVQETFGIALIEAMAAGLPVVASDWNGYKELVEHGVNGFLVETMWNAGVGGAVHALGIVKGTDRHFLYAQNVCVDMDACADAMRRLARDRDLRLTMGRHARRTAERYGWPRVVPLLEDAWNESLRIARGMGADARGSISLYGLDMIQVHDHYATRSYADADDVWFERDRPDAARDAGVVRAMSPAEMPETVTAIVQEIERAILDSTARTIGAIVDEVAEARQIDKRVVKYCVIRLMKHGVLRLARPEEALNAQALTPAVAGERCS